MPVQTLGIDIGGSSVKAAGLRDGQVLWTGRSRPYARPTLDQLRRAIREAVAGNGADAPVGAVGLCVPGPLDPDGRCVALSVNVPDLVGVHLRDLLAHSLEIEVSDPTPATARPVLPPLPLSPPSPLEALRPPQHEPDPSSALGPGPASVPLTIVTDALAAAHDLYVSRRLTGRLFALVLGTGVGAAVLDEAGPLRVDGDSPGHFGQLDVSLESPPATPPLGPDGGAGSLEAYLGAAALRRAYGPDVSDLAAQVGPDDPPARALARAIRVAHAIYRPHHVILAGGLGVRLGRLVDPLRRMVEMHLTSIARPDRTLSVADHDFHAAAGAARLAVREDDKEDDNVRG